MVFKRCLAAGTDNGWTLRLSIWPTIAIMCLINCISYVDRGVIPGGQFALADFISASFNGDASVDKWVGILQSSFIVGYSITSTVMGHLVHRAPPFKLMAIGLMLWAVAVTVCGFSPNYWVLLVARAFSGVGEASFQCVVPPWLDDNAPPGKRGLVLAMFYLQIPFGTAVGYAYGGFISKHLSWEWMFRLEVLPMLPLIAMIWFMPYNMTRRIVTEEVSAALAADTTSGDAVIADGVSPKAAAAYASSSGSAAASVAPAKAGKAGKSGKGKSAAEEELLAGLRDGEPGAVAHTPTHAAAAGDAGARATHLSVHGKQHYAHHVPPTAAEVNREVADELAVIAAAGDPAPAEDTVEGPKAAFCDELKAVLFNPIYLCVVFGYAGFTAVTAGVGTFAPTFIVGLKLIADETDASLYAGVMVCVASMIGVPIGGWLLDHFQRKAKAALDAEKAKKAALLGTLYSPTGTRKKLPVPPAITRSVSAGSVGAGSISAGSLTGSLHMPGATGSVQYAPLTGEGGAVDSSAIVVAPAFVGAPGADGAPGEEITEIEPLDEEEEGTSPEILDIKLHVTLGQAVILSAGGTVFFIGGCFVTSNLVPFLVVLACGCVLLMGTTAGINLAMMAAVPPALRSFAVGIGTLLLHALGDVPAQPIIGALADDLAPCDPDCNHRSFTGLRDTLLATTAWLIWPVILWLAAWLLNIRSSRQRRASGFYDAWNEGERRRRAETAEARARAASALLASKAPAGAGAEGLTAVAASPLVGSYVAPAAAGLTSPSSPLSLPRQGSISGAGISIGGARHTSFSGSTSGGGGGGGFGSSTRQASRDMLSSSLRAAEAVGLEMRPQSTGSSTLGVTAVGSNSGGGAAGSLL